MKWIPITEALPLPQTRNYVVCERDTGFRFQTMAEWIPPNTVRFEDYIDPDVWYDRGGDEEEGEMEFAPGGWYEWSHVDEAHILLDIRVTHWMSLLTLPDKNG